MRNTKHIELVQTKNIIRISYKAFKLSSSTWYKLPKLFSSSKTVLFNWRYMEGRLVLCEVLWECQKFIKKTNKCTL